MIYASHGAHLPSATDLWDSSTNQFVHPSIHPSIHDYPRALTVGGIGVPGAVHFLEERRRGHLGHSIWEYNQNSQSVTSGIASGSQISQSVSQSPRAWQSNQINQNNQSISQPANHCIDRFPTGHSPSRLVHLLSYLRLVPRPRHVLRHVAKRVPQPQARVPRLRYRRR